MQKVMVHFNFPGVTTEQYDKAWSDVREAGYSIPEGLLHHVGAQNGPDLLVVDVWESAEAFAKFGEILGPIMARNGLNGRPTVVPVHYEYSGN